MRRFERKKGIPIRELREMPSRRQKAVFYIAPFAAGILNGIANFLIVIGTAFDGIGSAVTFPLITGGTILFTVLLSRLFYREKLSVKKLLSAGLIIAALVIFIL